MPLERNRRVLVIDDNRLIHDDFRKILSPPTAETAALNVTEAALFGDAPGVSGHAQFEVDSAYQGEEGMLLAQEAFEAGLPYAIAFVDVRMPPGWDGVETTKRIWAIDPEIQIVLCTAFSDYSWEDMFEKLGHRDGLVILKKPFDTIEALQLAHALTEKWWLHRRAKRKMEELESRVAERTGELQQLNEKLRTEITEHQRAEKLLRESDEKFRQLADNITDAFWISSPDMREVHYVSRAFERIWGCSVESLLANPQKWDEFILLEDHDRVSTAFAKLAADTPSLDIDYRIMRPDAQIRSIHVRAFQVRDSANKLVRLTGIVTDITERKQFEAQLFQSQKLETVGKLAGGVAHGFNSILTVILGQSELMLSCLPPEDPLSKNAAEIHKAAERAAILTRQLLAYGRKQLLQPQILDLNAVISHMQNRFPHLIGGEVQVRIIPGAGLGAVKADLGQIEQVIMNIIMNAGDAMPNGGTLTLETTNVTLDESSVERPPELKPGDYVMLILADTGKGMTEDVRGRVFEPFFTTKGVGQGTGLGLSTCYGIIKQSGGDISVSSERAGGAEFKIYLPRVQQGAKPPAKRLDASDLPRGTETILLVDGDSTMCELASTLLRHLGYTVLTAANGLEALALRQQKGIGPIDLLFTDVALRDMSGTELSCRVRSLYPETKVVFSATQPENPLVNQSAGVLKKPFTPSALAWKLREALDE